MQIQSIDLKHSEATFQRIKNHLRDRQEIIHIDGQLQLTKTELSYSDALLVKDSFLEQSVRNWIEDRSSFHEIIQRYHKYDSKLLDFSWPEHYPFRVLAGSGAITSGSNIFMFFPQVLGIHGRGIEDYFGFEFVDVWENILKQSVLPCLQRVCTTETQTKLALGLYRELSRSIYLASVFHEVGHRVGPWRVSPALSSGVKVQGFQLDVLGELAADCLIVHHLPEFPELLQFIIFQRIFCFGRKGFRENPASGLINRDNDSWIGSFLWNRLLENGGLHIENGKLNFDHLRSLDTLRSVIKEIDCLGERVQALSGEAEQKQAVFDWMRTGVEHNGKSFQIPFSLQVLFHECSDIAETPLFSPLVKRQFSKIQGEI